MAAVSGAGAAESLQPKRPLPSTDEFYRDAGARLARLSLGWGVREGDVDATTGLPKTHQGTGGWLAPAQRFPVQLAFETTDGPPRGVRYNARASVILYTGEHPVANVLAWLWIRLIAALTYVS